MMIKKVVFLSTTSISQTGGKKEMMMRRRKDIGGNDCDKVDIVCKVASGRLVNVFANHFACPL